MRVIRLSVSNDPFFQMCHKLERSHRIQSGLTGCILGRVVVKKTFTLAGVAQQLRLLIGADPHTRVALQCTRQQVEEHFGEAPGFVPNINSKAVLQDTDLPFEGARFGDVFVLQIIP